MEGLGDEQVENNRKRLSLGLLSSVILIIFALTTNNIVSAEEVEYGAVLNYVEEEIQETQTPTPKLATASLSSGEVILNSLELDKNRYLAGEAVTADINIDFFKPMAYIELIFESENGEVATLQHADMYNVSSNTYEIKVVFRAFEENTTYTFKGGQAGDFEGNIYPINYASVSASFYVEENPDKLGPVFEKITPTGDNFQTGEGRQILVRMTDNSKVEYVYLVYETKDKQHQVIFDTDSLFRYEDIDKNTYFGYASGLILEPGEYHLVEAVAYDEFMNEKVLADLSLSPVLKVAQNKDAEGPRILDIHYDSTAVNVGEPVLITVTASDVTDVTEAMMYFNLFDENGKWLREERVPFNEFRLTKDGNYEGTAYLYGTEPNTTLEFFQIITFDSYFNLSDYFNDEFPQVITVKDNVMITPNIARYEGYSRENVAIEVARNHFSDANKVILVNRDKFPDAISATNISQGRYPVLYTYSTHLGYNTREFLKTMNLDEVYILGGELSVDDNAFRHIGQDLDVKVTRIDGRSRYDANVNSIRRNYNHANHVIIASGEVYSDALYGVSYANTINAPVVLSKTNNLEDSTIDLLKDLGTKEVTIIGGKLSVTEAVEKQLQGLGIKFNRIAGRNRYIGSAQVADAAYQNPKDVIIASGEVFSDALVSAPLAQKLNAPILLTRQNSMEPIVQNYLKNKGRSIENIYLLGGPVTISEEHEKTILDTASYLE